MSGLACTPVPVRPRGHSHRSGAVKPRQGLHGHIGRGERRPSLTGDRERPASSRSRQTIAADQAVPLTDSNNLGMCATRGTVSDPRSLPFVTVRHRSLWHECGTPTADIECDAGETAGKKRCQNRFDSGTDNAEVGGSIPPSPTKIPGGRAFLLARMTG
jgi:hypothetical protein